MNGQTRLTFTLGTAMLGFAIILGTIVSLVLPGRMEFKFLICFQAGVTYQIYHGLALVFLGLIENQFPKLKVNYVAYLFLAGIGLYSGMFYLYAFTKVTVFRDLAPVGGLCFITGWFLLFAQFGQLNKRRRKQA